MNPGKIRENSIILRSGALCAKHWKIIENIGKSMENQWNSTPLREALYPGKRCVPDEQVHLVHAFFRLPERLGGPPETVEKAWKSMYFPAWRPGATRGLRKTWKIK